MKSKHRQTRRALAVSLIAIAAIALLSVATVSAAETLIPKAVDKKNGSSEAQYRYAVVGFEFTSR